MSGYVSIVASVGDDVVEVRARVLVEGSAAYVGVVEALVGGAWRDLWTLGVTAAARENIEAALAEAALEEG